MSLCGIEWNAVARILSGGTRIALSILATSSGAGIARAAMYWEAIAMRLIGLICLCRVPKWVQAIWLILAWTASCAVGHLFMHVWHSLCWKNDPVMVLVPSHIAHLASRSCALSSCGTIRWSLCVMFLA